MPRKCTPPFFIVHSYPLLMAMPQQPGYSKRMRLTPLLALATVLAGCTHYIEPLGGNTAKLRLVSLPGNITEIRALENPRCIGSGGTLVAKLGLNVKDGANQGRSLQIPLHDPLPRAATSELNVRADQPIALLFKAASGRGPKVADWSYPACNKAFTLTAKEGELYEAQFEQLQNDCQLNVFRISREKDGSYIRRLAGNAKPLKARCN